MDFMIEPFKTMKNFLLIVLFCIFIVSINYAGKLSKDILPSKVNVILPYCMINRPFTGEGFYFLAMIRTSSIKKKSGIYKIKSNKNNKIYIGSAIGLKKRKYFHCNDLQKGKHCNRHLQNHFNKYGIDDLEFYVIEYCKKEKLIEREQFWIDILKPKFNICKIAGNRLGVKASKETKAKIGKASLGRKLSIARNKE